MVAACGYYLDEKRLAQLNVHLDEKKVPKIDERVLIQVLTYLKELELMNEQENESDEYCKCGERFVTESVVDAFVALGGEATKEGTISKNTLISIIKTEFELTIDMEEYLRKIGGDTDNINYYQFCVMLDACPNWENQSPNTTPNSVPSRICVFSDTLFTDSRPLCYALQTNVSS